MTTNKDLPLDKRIKLIENNLKLAFPNGVDDDLICIAELDLIDHDDICDKCTRNGPLRCQVTPSLIIVHPDFYDFRKKVLKSNCTC